MKVDYRKYWEDLKQEIINLYAKGKTDIATEIKEIVDTIENQNNKEVFYEA